MLSQLAMLAAVTPNWVFANIEWFIAGLIVIAGLVVYGGRDLFRLSLVRIRAVASVCFRESIRRKVLWLIPLAIVGVILVSQFQAPLDEQDAIRQVTKFCLFTAGMLITMASVILACTNLPREIENRVIYTVVTKPTSRLEILVGKIVGFAGVSAAILIIMGLFTWGYVSIHEWTVQRTIQARLQAGGLEPAAEQTLKYYSEHGVLDARKFVSASDLQVYSKYPTAGEKGQWIAMAENEAYLPFDVSDELNSGHQIQAVAISIRMPWERRQLTKEELQQTLALTEAAGIKLPTPNIPAGPGETPQFDMEFPGFVNVSIAGKDLSAIVESSALHGQTPMPLKPVNAGANILPLSPDTARRMLTAGRFYVHLQPAAPGIRCQVDVSSVALLLKVESQDQPISIRSRPIDPKFGTDFVVAGRINQNGQQLASASNQQGPVAVIGFRSEQVPQFEAGLLGFEFRTALERGGEELDEQAPTFVEVRVVDKNSGKISDPVKVAVESRRAAHFTLPSSVISSGNFDVTMKLLTPHQWLSLKPGTLRLVSENEGFGFNLLKSLLILWMFSVLVITIAIFCSTFVSWPIALVLTLVILLGHWGVGQLGDFTAPGVGRQVVNDLFSGTAPAVAETLNRSVEGLSSLTRTISMVLPDISQFAAMSDIEQGVAISLQRILDPLAVLALFGLPILSLSYVFFRNKEVAP